MCVKCEIPGLNLGMAFNTADLECERGKRNGEWSSEMH